MLAVTTSYHPKPHHIARAEEVARRCGAPVLARRGPLEPMFRPGEIELIYVVSKRRDELVAVSREHIFVHQGLI